VRLPVDPDQLIFEQQAVRRVLFWKTRALRGRSCIRSHAAAGLQGPSCRGACANHRKARCALSLRTGAAHRLAWLGAPPCNQGLHHHAELDFSTMGTAARGRGVDEPVVCGWRAGHPMLRI
jgi:hypothetical protein